MHNISVTLGGCGGAAGAGLATFGGVRGWTGLVGVVLLAACTPPPPPAPAVVPTFDRPSQTVAAGPTSQLPALPASCESLVSGRQLDAVLGAAVSEQVNVVRGEAIPDIGRTGRTTCRYGDPAGSGYPVEVSLTSYATPAQAAARVEVTVTSAGRQGVVAAPLPVGGTDGVFLPYPGTGLVVASAGIFSVAVTVRPGVLPGAVLPERAASVAGVVLAAAGV